MLLLLACANPWDKDDTERVRFVDTADTDSGADTAETGDTDSGPTGPHMAAADAVGTCLEEADLAGASALTVTTLYEGQTPGEGWDRVPATSVIADETAWATFQSEFSLALGFVDFSSTRVVVLTDWQQSTCGVSVESVGAWAMPDGLTTYVEGRMRTEGTGACDTGCGMETSHMIVVAVPSAGGVAACRRTEHWCG